jgi:hypothetical protein
MTFERRAQISQRLPIDAGAVVYNSLADRMSRGVVTIENGSHLTPRECEQELEWLSEHVLADLLRYYRLTKRDTPLPVIL